MSVKRHTSYNLLGSIVPLALALVTVPIYLKVIGHDRYGVLSIAWLFLGYFGLFDLGLGKATSFRIAALREATPEERSSTFWSAVATNSAMGLVGGLVLWAAASFFYARVIKVDEALRPEVLRAVPVLAASVPIATLAGVLANAMQGRERFLETNLISGLSTCLFHALPLAVAIGIGPDLSLLIGAALTARLLAVIALAVLCVREFGLVAERANRSELLTLLKYGGWVNLTSIFGPLLVFVDRFAIGSVLGAGAVAVYSVPFQLTRLVAVMPSALVNALFPKMSAGNAADGDALASDATRAMSFLLTPAVLAGIMGFDLFLHLWVGADMAQKAASIGRILLIGFWMNAFALLPFTKLQASGRPDLVTKVLLFEIPFYLAALYWSLTNFGLVGCAIAFAGRCALDYLLLSRVAKRPWNETNLLVINLALLTAAATAAAAWTMTQFQWWAAAIAILACTLVANWRALPAAAKSEILQYTRYLKLRPQ